MRIIRYAYSQYANNWSRTLLILLTLSTIMTIPILIMLVRGIHENNEVIDGTIVEYTFGFLITSIIGGVILMHCCNMILAFLFKPLVNLLQNRALRYKEVYNITLISIIPYALVNGCCRALFVYGLTDLFIVNIGGLAGWGLKLCVDALVILVIVFVIIKLDKKETN